MLVCLLCGYWYYCWTSLLIYFFLTKRNFSTHLQRCLTHPSIFLNDQGKNVCGAHKRHTFYGCFPPYSILIVIFFTEIKSKPDQARFGTSLSCLRIYQTIFCWNSHTQFIVAFFKPPWIPLSAEIELRQVLNKLASECC